MSPWYLYLLAFTGISLEGEMALITSSIAAQKGQLNLWVLAPLAFFTTLLADWGMFFGARLMGAGLFRLFPTLEQKIEKSHNRFDQQMTPILFLYRFMYGFRVITLIILGMSNVASSRFVTASLAAIACWTAIYILLGYYLGHVVKRYLVFFDNYIWYLFIVAVLLVIIIFIIRQLSRKVLD